MIWLLAGLDFVVFANIRSGYPWPHFSRSVALAGLFDLAPCNL
jgi:hypothetical protein